MKERPILFSAPMVRAILEGRKTQTRRVVKPQSVFDGKDAIVKRFPNQHGCQYGQPGDRLWVKETFCRDWYRDGVGGVGTMTRYRADGYVPNAGTPWKPSIFCRRIYSRITLEITGVRVERLQDISPADAKSEGVEQDRNLNWKAYDCKEGFCTTSKRSYQSLWDSINGKHVRKRLRDGTVQTHSPKHPAYWVDNSWAKNPWVWVIEFRKIGETK